MHVDQLSDERSDDTAVRLDPIGWTRLDLNRRHPDPFHPLRIVQFVVEEDIGIVTEKSHRQAGTALYLERYALDALCGVGKTCARERPLFPVRVNSNVAVADLCWNGERVLPSVAAYSGKNGDAHE